MSTITVSAGLPALRPMAARGTAARPATLTRRGRLLMSAVVLVLLVAGAVLASGGLPATAGTETSPVTAERVTVRPGETLWAIAEREAPGVDPRETIAAILDLNALTSAAIESGSVLLLP